MTDSLVFKPTHFDILGAGLNLKPQHFEDALCLTDHAPFNMPLWFEVHTENYFVEAGPRLDYLQKIRDFFPLSFHGVGASLGNVSALTTPHLTQVAQLVERFDPTLVSEHATWSSSQSTYFADLLPLPRTHQALSSLCEGIDRYQNAIGRPILIENPTNYLNFVSDMDEADFLMEAVQRTGAGILLDVNNLYLSAQNTGMDIQRYLQGIDRQYVGEIHIAGFAVDENYPTRLLIDSHGSPVADPVWALLNEALSQFGPKPVLLERDDNIPAFADLMQECQKAQSILDTLSHPATSLNDKEVQNE